MECNVPAAQRGQMLPRGQNKWLLRIYRGRVEGKKKYASRAFTGTTSQARQALTALLREDDTQTFVPASKLALRDYLKTWLEGKIDVSSKTRDSYEDQLAHFSSIGHLKLTDVDHLSIQRCVKAMIEKELSPRSVSYSVRVLHGALEDAVLAHSLTSNPTDHVNRPKRIKRGATVLTLEQVQELLRVTLSDPFAVLWRLLLTTAMRPQEAFALKWTDIDFEGDWLSVRRTLVSDGKGCTSLVEDAKADSQRRIGLPPSTTGALRVYRKSQAAAILKAGPGYDRQDLVFANRSGKPLDIARVRRWWKKALTTAKLPEIRLYDCRHTHLTALLAGGADIAWVAARAGHKNTSTTLAHYAHVLPETHREMGQMTERLMLAAAGSKGQ